MNNVINILKNFSFSEQEAQVYLTALKLDKPTVTQLANKLDSGRTAIYFHIKNLVDKKALIEIKVGNKFKYSAVNPEELLKNIENNVSIFKDQLPELLQLNKIEKEIPLIEVRESAEAYLQFYDEVSHLPPNSEFRVLEGKSAVINELKSFEGNKWNSFFENIIERKIITKAIFTESGLKEAQKAFATNPNSMMKDRIWQMKSLPENLLPFNELICMYGNKVLFIFPESSMVVFIKHQRIAQAMRAVFDSLHFFANPVLNPWKK